MGNWLDKTGLTQLKNLLSTKFATKVDKHPGIAAGKFLQTDSNGDAIWGEAASAATVTSATQTWLANNISGGSTIAVDKSLSVANAAAEAKVTGNVKNAVLFDAKVKRILSSSDLIQGGYNSSGDVTNNNKRIRLPGYIPAYKGMTIYFVPGTNVNQFRYAKFQEDGSWIDETDWLTGKYTFDWDGKAIISFRNSNETAITPANFDAFVEIRSKTDEVISNEINKCLYNVDSNRVITSDMLINGGYNNQGDVTNNSARIRVKGLVPVKNGMTINFVPGTKINQFRYGSYSQDHVQVDTDWIGTAGRYSIRFDDGNTIIGFRNSGDTSINTSDFDATVVLEYNDVVQTPGDIFPNGYNGYFINENGIILIDDYFKYSKLIPVEYGKTYTITYYVNAPDNGGKTRIHGYDANYNHVAQIQTTDLNHNGVYVDQITISNHSMSYIRISTRITAKNVEVTEKTNHIISRQRAIYFGQASYTEEACRNRFRLAMREKATSIGMTHTTIGDGGGYPIETTTTTMDMIRLLIAAMGYREIRDIWNVNTGVIRTKDVENTITLSSTLYSSQYISQLTNYYTVLGYKTGGGPPHSYLVACTCPQLNGHVLVGCIAQPDSDSASINRPKITKILMDLGVAKFNNRNADVSSYVSSLSGMSVTTYGVVLLPNCDPGLLGKYNFENDSYTMLYNSTTNSFKSFSLIKLLCAITALDYMSGLDTRDNIVSSDLLTGTGAFSPLFALGENISYRDALKALLLPSCNQAAYFLERNVGREILENYDADGFIPS